MHLPKIHRSGTIRSARQGDAGAHGARRSAQRRSAGSSRNSTTTSNDDRTWRSREGSTKSVVADAEQGLQALKAEADRATSLKRCCSGEADRTDTFLEVHAGAGGTGKSGLGEACSCACSCAGPSSTIQGRVCSEESPGEEAGLKSATVKISGRNAFGWLKSEKRCASARYAFRRSIPMRGGIRLSPA